MLCRIASTGEATNQRCDEIGRRNVLTHVDLALIERTETTTLGGWRGVRLTPYCCINGSIKELCNRGNVRQCLMQCPIVGMLTCAVLPLIRAHAGEEAREHIAECGEISGKRGGIEGIAVGVREHTLRIAGDKG